MHSLSTSFVLGYHGCDRETGERFLHNEAFRPSENDYDWLGSGIYFWESNPDRALDWARHRAAQKLDREQIRIEPFVAGAVIDPGFCLDITTSNGIYLVEQAHANLQDIAAASNTTLPINSGGDDLLLRKLDCAVINFIHSAPAPDKQPPFDTVRGVFMEGERIYENSGFRRKTHLQICVRNPGTIKGVFRAPSQHFTNSSPFKG